VAAVYSEGGVSIALPTLGSRGWSAALAGPRGYVPVMTGRAELPQLFAADYLALTVRLGRLVPGLIAAGNVDPDLWQRVSAEPMPRPADLVRQSGRLAQELADIPLDPARRDFLAGQLRAVECAARRLAGQRVPFVREMSECFDVVPRRGCEDDYAAAHAELAALLPGSGSLAARLAAYRRAHEVPPDRLASALATLSELLRGRTGAVVSLPPAEAVSFRVTGAAPWSALHRYRGRFRSRITVNAGARPRRTQLAQLVAHEAYPGHHTERCRKEAGIGRAWPEHAVLVANSPQSVVAEGAAELGLTAVLGPGWGPLVADALAGPGLGFDGELAERVETATARLARVRQDAALLLHDRGAPVELVLAHLRRWLLVDEPRARQIVGFMREPVWRGYTTTYVEGAELVHAWWTRDPGPERLRRLLDEPLTPRALRAELPS
jgi:hypothetical protein